MAKQSWISVRVHESELKDFDTRARRHGNTRSRMLQEIIAAFLEGRLSIRANKPTKEKENDYEH